MVPREALALSTGQELGIVGEQAAFQEGLQGQFYSGARPVPSAGTPGPVHLSLNFVIGFFICSVGGAPQLS